MLKSIAAVISLSLGNPAAIVSVADLAGLFGFRVVESGADVDESGADSKKTVFYSWSESHIKSSKVEYSVFRRDGFCFHIWFDFGIEEDKKR